MFRRGKMKSGYSRRRGSRRLNGQQHCASVHSRIPRRKFRETIHVIKPIEKSVSLFTQGGRGGRKEGGVAAGRSRGENDPQTRRHPFRHRLRLASTPGVLYWAENSTIKDGWPGPFVSSLPGTVLQRMQRELY